jgi:hypothetical protein
MRRSEPKCSRSCALFAAADLTRSIVTGPEHGAMNRAEALRRAAVC